MHRPAGPLPLALSAIRCFLHLTALASPRCFVPVSVLLALQPVIVRSPGLGAGWPNASWWCSRLGPAHMELLALPNESEYPAAWRADLFSFGLPPRLPLSSTAASSRYRWLPANTGLALGVGRSHHPLRCSFFAEQMPLSVPFHLFCTVLDCSHVLSSFSPEAATGGR